MARYPTSISRRRRGSQNAGGLQGLMSRGGKPAQSFAPPELPVAALPASRMAAALARPAYLARMLPVAGTGFLLGILLGEKLFGGDDLYTVHGPIIGVDPPPGFTPGSICTEGPPWSGDPRWSHSGTVARRVNSYECIPIDPDSAGEAPPGTGRPTSVQGFGQWNFNGNPAGWYSEYLYEDFPGNAPSGLVIDETGWSLPSGPTFIPGGAPDASPFPNLQHIFPELAPDFPFPNRSPGDAVSRRMVTSPFPYGYQIGPEGDLAPEIGTGGDQPPTVFPPQPTFPASGPAPKYERAQEGRPIPTFATSPNVVVTVAPGGPPTIESGPYLNVPPGPREKEKKVRTSADPRMLLTKIFNATSEFRDAVEDFYFALPLKYRKGRKRTLQNMLDMLYRHWDEVDFSAAMRNFVFDQASDYYYGALGRAGGNAQRALHDAGIGPSSGPTLATRTSRLGVGRLAGEPLPEWLMTPKEKAFAAQQEIYRQKREERARHSDVTGFSAYTGPKRKPTRQSPQRQFLNKWVFTL